MSYPLGCYPLGVAPQTKFWVLIRLIQLNLKIKDGLMVVNLFRFNIKLVLGPRATSKGSPDGKIVVFNKMCH